MGCAVTRFRVFERAPGASNPKGITNATILLALLYDSAAPPLRAVPNATATPALTEPFTPEASDPLAAAAAGTVCVSYGPAPPPHSSGGGGAMSLPIESELHTDSYIAAGPDLAAPAVVGVL